MAEMGFCKKLPKPELHAHLNGSLSESTLQVLYSSLPNDNPQSREKWSFSKKRTLDECFKIFDIAHAVTVTPVAVERATRDVISEFAADGVTYLELRSTPRCVTGGMTKDEYIAAILKAIKECKFKDMVAVKLLLSINRGNDLAEAEENTNLAIDFHHSHPDIVAGMDLSGHPSKGNIMPYLSLLDRARSAGLKIALHCAEIPNEDEILKMIDFKADRLGHGTCIHPHYGGTLQLWERFLKSQVPLEVCLTSNVKCGTVKSYESHHLQHLLHARYPVAISTDDKGVFGTSLSTEYHLCAQTFNLSPNQLCELSRMAVDASFASSNEKEILSTQLEEFQKREGLLSSHAL